MQGFLHCVWLPKMPSHSHQRQPLKMRTELFGRMAVPTNVLLIQGYENAAVVALPTGHGIH